MSSTLYRIVAIDQLIRDGQYPNVATLCARFEIKPRTVHDALTRLRDDYEAPLAYCHTRRGYYYTNPTYLLPAIIATEGELLAFFLSAELTTRYLGTAFDAPLRQAIGKIARYLPDQLSIDMTALTHHFTFAPGAVAGADPLLLAALSEAIVACHPLDITYFTASSGERNQRQIEPYHFINYRGDWQLVAFDHLRQKPRQFSVARIEQWTVRKDLRFVRDGFDMTSYMQSAFQIERGDDIVAVAIWFDPQQARYIRERQWHPTQRIDEHADGALTLHFASGALGEVQRWVMSYGSHARVIAPPALRDSVAAEAAALVAAYRAAAS